MQNGSENKNNGDSKSGKIGAGEPSPTAGRGPGPKGSEAMTTGAFYMVALIGGGASLRAAFKTLRFHLWGAFPTTQRYSF